MNCLICNTPMHTLDTVTTRNCVRIHYQCPHCDWRDVDYTHIRPMAGGEAQGTVIDPLPARNHIQRRMMLAEAFRRHGLPVQEQG